MAILVQYACTSYTYDATTTAANLFGGSLTDWGGLNLFTTAANGSALITARIYDRALSAAEVAQNYAAGPTAASTEDRSSLIAFGIC